MPSRERLWMCPNHLENFLDQYLVKSSRLSERINMWKDYSFSRDDLNAIKTDFIKKCSKNKLVDQKNIKSNVKRCQIPESIKNAYVRPQSEPKQIDSEQEAVNIINFQNLLI